MNLKKIAAAAAFVIGAVGSAQANPIGLALVLDESGSISGANWTLQKNGYISAVQNVIATNGSLVVGVWKFDDSVEQVFGLRLMDDAGDMTALVAALNGMSQGGGLTAIGDAVTVASNAFAAFGFGNLDKAIIDVSTDGVSNTGAAPGAATTNALAAGVTAVNCLGIGASANCGWNGSGLDFTSVNFADFQSTLELKIRTETGQLPEPGTLALVGLAIAGLGFGARRRG
jgi:Protein of unknown function (DUF1194)/PEP-CTERM motif